MYQRLDDLYALQQQAILGGPGTLEQKSRLLDKLRNDLAASLAGQIMPYDDTPE
jgi:hypothetical protein